MKIKNIKWMAMVAFAAVATSLASCSDQPDAYETTGGTPSIDYIRPVSAASKDSLLDGAYMSNTICIVGKNLRSIKKLNFNDQTAVLNTSYMTDNTIVVTVPMNIPEVVTDKIYMITTGNDTVAYDFKVRVPAPTVSSMSNEWAKAGEEVTIKGDYFLDYPNSPLTITFPNNYTLDSKYIKSITKTAITFEVPDDAPAGYVTVNTMYGKTRSPFQFRDSRGMLFDFDTPCFSGSVLGNHGWHNQVIRTDDTSLSGNYLMLGDVDLGADGAWNDGNFSFEYWPGTWNQDADGNYLYENDGVKLTDVVDFTDYKDMCVKFEICVPASNPWSAAPLQIIFAGTDKIKYFAATNTFFHNSDGWPRALYMPWKSTGSFDTGDKWVTVTIPMSDFNMDYDGNKASGSFSSADDFASLTLFVVTGAYNDKTAIPTGKDCHPIIKIDNIRVVPNK